MVDNTSNFRRGSVELLVLYLLSGKDYYGYELSQAIKTHSEEVLDIPVGSLYPALYKAIDKGYVTDYKEQVGKRLTRVYYHLEDLGKERLQILIADYYSTNTAIKNILKFDINEEGLEDLR